MRMSSCCGTLQSTWTPKTAVSGSTGLTSKKRWPSQIAGWSICGNWSPSTDAAILLHSREQSVAVVGLMGRVSGSTHRLVHAPGEMPAKLPPATFTASPSTHIFRGVYRTVTKKAKLTGNQSSETGIRVALRDADSGRVEEKRGAVRLHPTVRFSSPLIEPDVRVSRIRLSDWLHRMSFGSSVHAGVRCTGSKCSRPRHKTP
jgi:hypothetical protein